jgi:hypothetical protein
MPTSTKAMTLLRLLAAWLHGELAASPAAAAQGTPEKAVGAQIWRRGGAATLTAAKASSGAAEGK